jgi:hypothetical protein
MIKYKFDGFYSANVEIDAKWNEIGDLNVTGKDRKRVKEIILSSHGMYGHLITERCMPADLYSAMLKIGKIWEVELLKKPRMEEYKFSAGAKR